MKQEIETGTMGAKFDRILFNPSVRYNNPIGVQFNDSNVILSQGDNIINVSKEMLKELVKTMD